MNENNKKNMNEDKDPAIIITKTTFEKCPRCWRHDPTCGNETKYKHIAWTELCYRCAEAVEDMYQSGELEQRDTVLFEYRKFKTTFRERVRNTWRKFVQLFR